MNCLHTHTNKLYIERERWREREGERKRWRESDRGIEGGGDGERGIEGGRGRGRESE